MNFVLEILVLAAAIYVANSLCNTCSAITNLACVSSNQFAVCDGGLPTSGNSLACPPGNVCTSEAQVCSTNSSKSACTGCGICDVNNTFACMSYNSFALCSGTTVPGSVSYNCSGSLVCSIDSPQICVDPSVTGIGGTCPSVAAPTTTPTTTAAPTTATPTTTAAPTTATPTTTAAPTTATPTTTAAPTTATPTTTAAPTTATPTTTAAPTTTPNPATSPQAYCASRGTAGRFDITTDATCQTYVFCTLSGGSWVGNLYVCPGSTFFNATIGMCTTATPTRCASS